MNEINDDVLQDAMDRETENKWGEVHINDAKLSILSYIKHANHLLTLCELSIAVYRDRMKNITSHLTY